MLDTIGVDLRSSRMSSRHFFAAWAVLSTVCMVPTCHSEAVGPGEVGGGCGVFYAMALEKLNELLRRKGLVIVH